MFKKFAVLSILFASMGALACENEQALFVGKVKNWHEIAPSESQTECFYQIEFTLLNPSYECPLVIGEASSYEFHDLDCSLKDGRTVSGQLTRSGEKIAIQLDQ